MSIQELRRTSETAPARVEREGPFDPYAPPRSDLLRPRNLETTRDWVYPLTLHADAGWLFKLQVELRDAIGREVLTGTFRWQLWELFGFRIRRPACYDLPWIEVKPRRLYAGTNLVVLDGGEETATLRSGFFLSNWTAEAPGGIWIQIRRSNRLIRWREQERGAQPWPAMAETGQQLTRFAPKGYPIMTVHAGPTQAPFLVVRRSFEGLLCSTRIERLEGEVKPEAEWLALQMLIGAYLCRVPGLG